MEDTWISGISVLYLISWTFKNLCSDQIVIRIIPHKWLLILMGTVTSCLFSTYVIQSRPLKKTVCSFTFSILWQGYNNLKCLNNNYLVLNNPWQYSFSVVTYSVAIHSVLCFIMIWFKYPGINLSWNMKGYVSLDLCPANLVTASVSKRAVK